MLLASQVACIDRVLDGLKDILFFYVYEFYHVIWYIGWKHDITSANIDLEVKNDSAQLELMSEMWGVICMYLTEITASWY